MDLKNLPIQWRSVPIASRAVDEEKRTIELVASTEETVVSRWWGQEQLMHGSQNVLMDRAQSEAGIPLLWGHDAFSMESLLGRIIEFRLDANAKCTRAVAQFATTEDAEKAMQLIRDGALRDVSIGYFIHEITAIRKEGVSDELQQITLWEPAEISLCSVPADPKAGIGRSSEPLFPVRVIRSADTTPQPPAAPAGPTMEVRMDPATLEAANKAADEVRNTIPGLLRGERAATVQLQTIAARMGLEKEAAEILAADKPLEEARAQILALVAERSAKPLPSPGVDMSKKEAKEYSYARAINAHIKRLSGVSVERGFEDEIHETIQRALPEGYAAKGGLFVPLQLRAGLDSVTSTAGAELKYTQYGGELIEILRNYAAVIKMGARVMPGLSGPVSFPKQTGDATVSWVAENPGSDVGQSAPNFSSVTLSAKIMQGAVPYSRSLMNQSVVAIESLVRESLAAGHALAIDKAALHGTGADNQPTGIYRTSGVNTKAMGGVPTHGKLQDMITEVATDNALMNALGWLTTPGMAGELAQTLKDSVAGAAYIWTGPYDDGMLNGYKARATNQVSALMNGLVDTGGTSHGALFGNWADVLVGFWGALELVVDPFTLKKQGMIEIATFQMGDVEVRHPQSFCVATGATIS